jgi:lipoprotein-anchoring transpeptidase ErfK/SrfK
MAVLVGPADAKSAKSRPATLTLEAVNAAQFAPPPAKDMSPVALKAQVLLARAGFSPGAIDGRAGENFEKTLRAYQAQNGLSASGKLDEPTWAKLLEASDAPVLVEYEITEADVRGPFVKQIPHDYLDMSKLERLGYRSPAEGLAEKFHMDEDLLVALNRGKDLKAAGAKIVVVSAAAPSSSPAQDANTASRNGGPRKKTAAANRSGKSPEADKPDVKVEVDKNERAVRVFSSDGKLLAFYPASIGSEEKPAPSGSLEVLAVRKDPTYRYDPKYAFKGQRAKEPVEVKPGPNNPVGAVWIALSAESYGIHGTPEPSKISKTESHGCVRLTNWDVLVLASFVKKGTPVEFKE